MAATEDDQLMPDSHFKSSLQRRLRVRVPAGGSCKHLHKTTGNAGAWCGKALDAKEQHSRTCKVGGAVLRRHDRIRDWLAAWVGEMLGQCVATEQCPEVGPMEDRREWSASA